VKILENQLFRNKRVYFSIFVLSN